MTLMVCSVNPQWAIVNLMAAEMCWLYWVWRWLSVIWGSGATEGLLDTIIIPIGSSEKLTACITKSHCRMAGAACRAPWCSSSSRSSSSLHNTQRGIILSMNQWPLHSALMNWDFFDAPTGVAHFDRSTQSNNTPTSLCSSLFPVALSHTLQLTALCLNPACLFCDGKASISVWEASSLSRSYTHRSPKSSYLPLLVLPVPHPSAVLLIVLHRNTHTHSGPNALH